ncbi:MAG TPA: biosynthetic arginine decarboxylase [Methanotrichaceae archaeon]|nr:MAG: Diaminopimelate decarboxylase [Methanosaeta sp. PtaU1.Bin028]HOT06749.1 biosynthetic arginine decarboxylase [Methanotrichaceae archaeon]HQF15946.1 biosynthetic arginine decarboxylase [Methanotrichaceae archaeon]HQI90706.1 biosynthetic arginine decarboxylase [Methanotrichaceae archaeon]HQJ28015.1 biosynthetic arginine decarboxylase [Methanotrichaceae archaeon]
MWKVDDSISLYGVREWGGGYFTINDKGNLQVMPYKSSERSVDVMDIIRSLESTEESFPVLLRFPQIIDDRLREIYGAFCGSIAEFSYPGRYQPVFPMKVNQRKEVIEYILQFGSRTNIGLEVGTKAELLAALTLELPSDALLICNGYKDEEYLRLAISFSEMYKIIIVVDLFEEVFDVLRCAEELGVRPALGIRVKLFSKGSGRWAESGGESSKFGLSTSETLEMMRILADHGMLDRLKMLHYHIGSQITDIRRVKDAMNEAARIYAKIKRLADIEYYNVGGGLSVDYDGSRTAEPSSANYSLREYSNDVVYTLQRICEEEGVPCPTIVSESGRAIAAYHSFLVFKVIGKKNSKDAFLAYPTEGDPAQIEELYFAFKNINLKNYKEYYHDALHFRDELMASFNLGNVSLEDRAKGESLFGMVCQRAVNLARQANDTSSEFAELRKVVGQKYIGNFSLFQSVPDMWGVGQIFPIMPLHRHREVPGEAGTIADITCDSDGEIKLFGGRDGPRDCLEMHKLCRDEDYYLGIFLLGAYQDTLGDFHNLLGCVTEIHLAVDEKGWSVCNRIDGDTCEKLLRFFNYDTEDYIRKTMNRHDPSTLLNQLFSEMHKALRGYTYYQRQNEVSKPESTEGSGLASVATQT